MWLASPAPDVARAANAAPIFFGDHCWHLATAERCGPSLDGCRRLEAVVHKEDPQVMAWTWQVAVQSG
jgi:hypothetical protein